MDANPVTPVGPESAEAVKSRLRAELSSARSGLTVASESLRHAANLPGRLKNELRQGWPALMGKHPWPWAIGMAMVGFLTARKLTKPRIARHTVIPHKASGPGWITQLMLSSAGFVLKPVVKEFLISRITTQLQGPPRRGGK